MQTQLMTAEAVATMTTPMTTRVEALHVSFKRLANTKNLTRYTIAGYFILYPILKFGGERYDDQPEEFTAGIMERLVSAFPRVTNPKKLANGHKAYSALIDALRVLQLGTDGSNMILEGNFMKLDETDVKLLKAVVPRLLRCAYEIQSTAARK